MKKILFLLLILSLSFSQCNGTASIYAPAVVGNDGDLVKISVKLIDGYGDIYLTASPNTGISTQVSAEDAVEYALKKSGTDLDSCDVLVSIGGKYISSYVDGPSAGVAISVATFAAIMGKEPRSDAIVTGATDSSGTVLPVGGLFEKAKAAIKSGRNYFVLPMTRIAEKVILSSLKEKYNITFIEISKTDQAFDFLVYGKDVPQITLKASKRAPPNVTVYHTEGLDKFREIALGMIELENKSINSLSTSTVDNAELKAYFSNEVVNQIELLNKGYFFTAANEAFLNYIDVKTMASVNNLDINKEYSETKSCLDRLPKIPKTDSNFEYEIGSDLREEWATKKLSTIILNDSDLVEEKYYIFNEIMYADAWCHISEKLRSIDTSGLPLDESKLKDIASELIKKADALEITSEDWKNHMVYAKDLYSKGKFGAAIYDATFAAVMHESSTNKRIDLKSEVEKLSLENRSSTWGKIYQTQGVFLSQSGSFTDAYRILTYAAALDNVTLSMNSIILQKDQKIDYAKSDQLEVWASILIIVVGVSSLLVHLLLKKRSIPGHLWKKRK